MANEFKVKNGLIVDGATTITGSVIATDFTGSLDGTASYALYAVNANINTSSFASTGSNTFTGVQTFNNDVIINGTASIAYLSVTYESASIIYSSGSNQLGDATNDTQTIIGITTISGSLSVTGSADFANGITGSLLGTASTASYVQTAQTASYVLQAVSSSYASTASYVTTAQTASYVVTAQTASYFNTSAGLNQNVVVNSGYYLQVGSYSKTFSDTVSNMDSIGSPWDVAQINFSTYPHKSIFMRYVLDDTLSPGTNMRAGTIMVVSDGVANINLTEVTTQDIGDTTFVDFTAAIVSGKNVIRTTIASGSWDVYFDYTII